ncbi:tyrosine-protein phosphatase [Eubacterium aggregans]|uniref:tyrosine-protein phosphatase n=1 Tax=Eubacterium aggregans TaxID=81409 RepID=UPI003F3D16EA
MGKSHEATEFGDLEIQVYLGNEVFYDPDILKILDSDQFSALNKSRYLLVETVRHDASVESFEDFLYRLQLKGYSPVIAHTERYDFVQEDPNVLLDLINKGSFIQMNMLSLTGYYGHGAKETAHIMLENNMAQFMTSDAHRARSYKLMGEALEIAQDVLGPRQFKRMMSDNPKVALGGNGRIECAPKAYTKRKNIDGVDKKGCRYNYVVASFFISAFYSPKSSLIGTVTIRL